MKTMSCRQLGGACDETFRANTFEEIAELSKRHGANMFQQGDKAHIAAMNEMSKLMERPEDMRKWFDDRRAEFESLLDD